MQRWNLRQRFERHGLGVKGYDGRDEHSLDPDREGGCLIGRSPYCDVVVPADIGGQKTNELLWTGDHWQWTVQSEWAQVRINGRVVTSEHGAQLLRPGCTIDILSPWCHEPTELLHTCSLEYT